MEEEREGLGEGDGVNVEKKGECEQLAWVISRQNEMDSDYNLDFLDFLFVFYQLEVFKINILSF